MNKAPLLPRRGRQTGFVLVTSLIFLVVITLLAVSAINSSMLQERMASNLREKSRARQSADAALRAAELQLSSKAMAGYQTARNCRSDDAEQSSNDGSSGFVICREGVFDSSSDSEGFFSDSVWNGPGVQTYEADDDITADVRYIIEELRGCVGSVKTEVCAVGSGAVRYRVTAFAHGQNPAAIAVSQSVYQKIF